MRLELLDVRLEFLLRAASSAMRASSGSTYLAMASSIASAGWLRVSDAAVGDFFGTGHMAWKTPITLQFIPVSIGRRITRHIVAGRLEAVDQLGVVHWLCVSKTSSVLIW
jgi:hypothetical protein